MQQSPFYSYFARRAALLIDLETQRRHILRPDQNGTAIRPLTAYFEGHLPGRDAGLNGF